MPTHTTHGGGRHEHGQNFLADKPTISKIIDLVAHSDPPTPIIEIGPGRGALTFGLQELDRALTGVEIDRRLSRWLQSRLQPQTKIINADFLHWPAPDTPHVIVGNLPFHQTTAILRRLFHGSAWSTAILLTQWEVARRRAGVGGATMMTAQQWPWYDFTLAGRVPAAAFDPRPTVDGGLLIMKRRRHPLIGTDERDAYRNFVHAVFTGRGRGLAQIVSRSSRATPRTVRRWMDRHHLPTSTLPAALNATQWHELFRATR